MTIFLNKSLLAVLALLSITLSQDNHPSLSSLTGTWEGSGRFLDIKWANEIGELPIKIMIDTDGGVTGTIGDAILIDTEIGTWKEDGFEIRAIIDGPLKRGKNYRKRKDHFILFGKIHETEMDCNYHLKSNYIFDISMNVCGVILKRVK